ncbi:TPA: hypothetical protein N0F65_011631 [Lagenidium giganteum]|uniref:tRNA (guanine(9)-N(1))-methyltransferase n=1 Tax=Lagenidium giganteum TaxID=4803 RepID=A0AAV2ZCK3_9STRA|nr:TPA: hypothetical protein N0F65_011631 [Lagenidium giganteum]
MARPSTLQWLAIATAAVAVVGGVVAIATARASNERKRMSKASKREQNRVRRRQKKDERLQARKTERSAALELRARMMTNEQRQEEIERIKMRRVEQYQKLEHGLTHGVRVVVDLAFAVEQTERECNSILKQVGCLYGYMKKCPLDSVMSLRLASFDGSIADLSSRHGVNGWKVLLHKDPLRDVYASEDIVYLSPDAETVLEEIDPSKVYVVGGIVDRTVRKNETLSKAQAHSYQTARLPLHEHMTVRKPVLNIDSVLIALNEFNNHHDWKRAFDIAVPKRLAH